MSKNKSVEILSAITVHMKYAKYIAEIHRREDWVEISERNCAMHIRKYPQLKNEIKKAYKEFVIPKRTLPSMRSLQFAGRPIDVNPTRVFNCFSGETYFMSSNGAVKFSDMVGRRLQVLSSDGKWRNADVKNFGVQSLNSVTFRPPYKSSFRTSMDVTGNHRWILHDGSVTTSLAIGDKVKTSKADIDESSIDYIDGFGHGVIFADGSRQQSRDRYLVRLCGEKERFLSKLLVHSNYRTVCYPPSGNGDPFVTLVSPHDNLKEVPSGKVSSSYIAGFIEGWLSCDGYKKKGIESWCLDTQDKEAADWFMRNCAYAGYIVTGLHEDYSETNYGKRSSPLLRISIREKCDIYVVDDIIPNVKEEEVYCVVEPVTQSFTLAGGILTGNCAYAPIDHNAAFSEAMFLLLGGTGYGFSVQPQHPSQLPVIKGQKSTTRRFVVGDSIEGWADAIKVLVESYFFNKSRPVFDYSDIRPKGAMLITSGGKAPGPGPLIDCVAHITRIFERAIAKNGIGCQLTTIQCHDIVCFIADSVLAGGIRRAALISLFGINDNEMIAAKSSAVPTTLVSKEFVNYTDSEGLKTDPDTIILSLLQNGDLYENVVIRRDKKSGEFWDLKQLEDTGTVGWWVCNPQRGRANNSVVLDRNTITREQFFDLWQRVKDSRAGEPGVYFTNNIEWGTNPCCEIGLRANQFCNLSEVNAHDIHTQEELNARVRAGAFLGTLQAGYTNYHYLRPIWQETTEKDALIGVGITGIGSGAILPLDLREAAKVVLEENARVAAIIGINPSARTTCVKPAGTSSLVLGSASGIHAWHNDYYIRRVRVGKNEAIYGYLAANAPELVADDVSNPESRAVIEVPQKAPEGAILRTESPADLLGRVHRFNTEWVKSGHRDGDNTHNVSCTISIKDDEWDMVGEWMWENRNDFNGISVLPYDGGTYVQAPFEDITEEEYNRLESSLHSVDLTKVIEMEDNTDLKGEIACGAGGCEVK